MPQNMKQENRCTVGASNTQIPTMDSQVGENLAKTIPTTKTIIHDGKTYYINPIYDNYAASEDGYIINNKSLIPRKEKLHMTGYLNNFVSSNDGKRNKCLSHRIIWEAVNQQIIPDGYQIHHINCDKQDNSINNLELVTRQQNMKYEGLRRKGRIHYQKPNIEMKCEIFHYHPIYTNYGVNKYGQIYNKKTKRCSIRSIQSTGYLMTTVKQIGLSCKHFLVHRLVYECYNGDIPDKMQINHIDSNRQNNCIDNLELVTRSENAKHAHEAKKYKTKIEITTDKPIESIKLDIKLKESDDDFTEDEKQLIDKKYNAMMKKIENGKFPYQKQLQEHFPNMNFY